MRHCVKEVDSLFHPKVRWGEDSIFDAPAGIGGEACPAGSVEGVYGFQQADGADGDQVFLIAGLGVVFFGDVRHQPQVVADELLPRGWVAAPQCSKGFDLFLWGQRPRKASGIQMECEIQKFCGKKLQKNTERRPV